MCVGVVSCVEVSSVKEEEMVGRSLIMGTLQNLDREEVANHIYPRRQTHKHMSVSSQLGDL